MAGKKKSKKKVIAGVAVLAAAAIAGGSFFNRAQQAAKAMEEMAAASRIQSAEVRRGTIEETVTGSGTLAADDAEDILMPTGIVIDEVLVEKGDTVKAGQTLATINLASIDSAVAEVQSSITSLDEKLEDLDEDGEEQKLKATVSGRVKTIYAAVDESVQDVLKEHGALMLLSADGLMAADLSADAAAGDEVTVIRADGSELTGTVANAAAGRITVTLTDDGTLPDEEVEVKNVSGTSLGKGTLYIHQPLAVTASSGTITKVYVSENQKIRQGDGLLYLKKVKDTAARNEYLSERNELTDRLSELLDLRGASVIVSTIDGTVSAVNVEEGEETSKTATTSSAASAASSSAATQASYAAAAGLMSSASGYTTGNGMFFTVTSDAEPAQIGTASESQRMAVQKLSAPAASSADPAAAGASESAGEGVSGKTEIASFTVNLPAPEAGSTVSSDPASVKTDDFCRVLSVDWGDASTIEEGHTYYPVVTLAPADGYVFAANAEIQVSGGGAYKDAGFNEDGSLWVQLAFDYPEPEPQEEPTAVPTEIPTDIPTGIPGGVPSIHPTESVLPTGEGTTDLSGIPTGIPETSGTGSGSTYPTVSPDAASAAAAAAGGLSGSSLSGSALSGSSLSGYSFSGADGSTGITASSAAGTSTSALYSSNEMAAFSVTNDEYMKLSISVDELDILSLEKGQKAKVELDALEGQYFEGIVDEVGTSGTTSGGSSKFTVNILLPKTEQMLVGMSATATVTVNAAENVLTIPAAAVQERGRESFVFSEKTEDNTLAGEVTVETGLSDDDRVEITSGLSEGQTIYYEELTGSEIASENAAGMQFGMGGGRGGMDEGDRPSGGDMGGGPGGEGGGPGDRS